jgi:GT2 family glycosyltransferase
VLLPTFRRPHHLPLTLEALAVQDPGVPWELVVVDNDPEGTGARYVEQLRPAFTVPVRYLIEPRRGAAAARNRGIAEARGEVVAMLDDDVLPQPDWLQQLVEPILSGRADGAGGRVLLDPAVATPRWFRRDLLGGLLSHFDPADSERQLVDDEFVVTANAAFRLADVRAMGGFDAALGPHGSRHMVNDDLQLVRDLRLAGARLVYAPAAAVQHELPVERLRLLWLLRRAWWQGRSDWVLARQEHAQRRLNGARVAVTHGALTVRTRLSERPRGIHVAVRIACDLAVTGGALAEALSWRSAVPDAAGPLLLEWTSSEVGPPEVTVDVTVMVPTYRRPASLARCLEALTAVQLHPTWELLVVDNDPQGGALVVVQAAASGLAAPVRYVLEPSLGAARARNRGIAEARGALTVMLDDDVVVRPDWLTRLLGPLLADRADVAGGQVVLDPGVPRPSWFADSLIGGYVARLDLGPVERPLSGAEIVLTASAAFRTAQLRSVGGFDSRLGPSGSRQIVHDDTQLVRSLTRAGARVVYVPEAVAVHELPSTRLRPRWIVQRAFWQGRSDWLLDSESYRSRRWNGARVAVVYWSQHVREDWLAPTPQRRARAFAVLCSTARCAGALAEAAAWQRAAPPGQASTAGASTRDGVEP